MEKKEYSIEVQLLLFEKELELMKIKIEELNKLSDRVNSTYYKLESVENTVTGLSESFKRINEKLDETNHNLTSFGQDFKEKSHDKEKTKDTAVISEIIKVVGMVLLLVAAVLGYKLV